MIAGAAGLFVLAALTFGLFLPSGSDPALPRTDSADVEGPGSQPAAASKPLATPPGIASAAAPRRAGPESRPGPRISGRVTDSRFRPIPGAALRIETRHLPGRIDLDGAVGFSAEALAGDDGRFAVPVPGRGPYGVEITAPGFAPWLQSDIAAGADVEVILREGVSLTAVVLEQGDERPIPGARVIARRDGGAWRAEAATGAAGSAVLMGLPAGPVLVDIMPESHEPPATVTLELAEGPNRRTWRLTPGKSIAGLAIDGSTRQPLPDADVVAADRQTRTDASGSFAITGLSADSVTVNVRKDGWIPVTRVVNLAGARREAATGPIVLQRGREISGTVKTREGLPVPGARVALCREPARSGVDTKAARPVIAECASPVMTDAEGRFVIAGVSPVPAEDYRYAVRATSLEAGEGVARGIRIGSEDDRRSIDVVIEPWQALEGTVRTEGGEPVKGARVVMQHAGGIVGATPAPGGVTTDAGGRFVFSSVARGPAYIEARAEGFVTAGASVSVPHSAESAVTIVLSAGRTYHGLVEDDAGRPVPDAMIRLAMRDRSFTGASASDGSWRVEGVTEGSVDAAATRDGYGPALHRNVLSEDGRIDFVLERGGEVRGVVRDDLTGEPVRRFRIVAAPVPAEGESPERRRRRPQQVHRTVHTDTGTFAFTLPRGTYRLTVDTERHVPWALDAIAVAPDAPAEEIRVSLVPGGSVEGRVTDGAGQGLSGCLVIVTPLGATTSGARPAQAWTAMDGYYLVRGLPPGVFALRIENDMAVLAADRRFESRPGLELILDVSVPATGSLRLTVTAGRRAASPVLVSLFAEDGTAALARKDRKPGAGAATAETPCLSLKPGETRRILGLPAGRYRLEAHAAGMAPFVRWIRIDGGRETHIAADLQPLASGR